MNRVEYYVPQAEFIYGVKLKELNEIKLLEESIKRGVIYVPGSTLGTKKDMYALPLQEKMRISFTKGSKDLQPL